ncbi:hydrogenase formation protein HypD [Thermococcus sp. Bubb.Bath]|uniref:hydrogenase formation protein HypD n=1 Tax=Thermococcus sp. Bubb.Bath TaxID=1638242 RepID=UPI00143A44A1|nr:hydrogenase formation protein HypD [Thermococcus sp. Bubb.Bath]NJF25805.1 hydrogenase formation protein HypD [Thermococcus sp. Bubb.Bath]
MKDVERVIAPYRDRAIAQKLVEKIKEEAKTLDGEIRIMHVCGSHEDTITRYGIRSLLPKNVKVVSGPGCPVCITPIEDIIAMQRIMRKAKEEGEEIILTTFGDMYKIPTPMGSFADLKSEGFDVRIVYGIYDTYRIAKENPDKTVVHFSPGFETTTAPTAGMLNAVAQEKLENFKIYSVHRLTPQGIEVLIKQKSRIDALIDAGHVSTIIGVKGWEFLSERYGTPQVVAGFEPNDVLMAVLLLIRMYKEGDARVVNEYKRSVKYEGNVHAQKLIDKYLKVVDAKWRALGIFPKTGLKVRNEWKEFEIRNFYKVEVPKGLPELEKGCLCAAVLRGLAMPTDCPHFGKDCTPRHPIGPCMVSYEGSCNVFYRYGVLY